MLNLLEYMNGLCLTSERPSDNVPRQALVINWRDSPSFSSLDLRDGLCQSGTGRCGGERGCGRVLALWLRILWTRETKLCKSNGDTKSPSVIRCLAGYAVAR